jgi:hypothetical protein
VNYPHELQKWVVERELAIMEAPGYEEFRRYLNVHLGMDFIPEASKEVIRRVSRKLDKSFDEVCRLTLLETLDILNQAGPEDSQTTSGPLKKPRRKRNEGKAERCVGLYMAAVIRNETPPTPSEVAEKVGCNIGTACRAIAEWEAKRKELAKEDAKDLYRDAD